MCVIFFYVNSNPAPGGYKLILASNRDEFYARETRNVAKWANAEHVYGGIDLEPGREGGTWLAIGGDKGVFKVGALLNLSGEPKYKDAHAHNYILHCDLNNKLNVDDAPAPTTITTSTTIHNNNFLLGRGMIVADFVKSLANECTIDDYNQKLVSDCTKYNAFNFISIEISQSNTTARINLCSNVPPGIEQYAEGCCYGFGNSLPSAPFEKVRHGQQRFEEIVNVFNAQPSTSVTRDKLVQQCQKLLKCREKSWPDAELQRRAPNWGEHLSALNVHIPEAGYGSRTHTVILLDDKNKLHFHEETMAAEDPDDKWTTTYIEKQYFDDLNKL